MFLLLAIILIVLGFLVLALKGVFGIFPFLVEGQPVKEFRSFVVGDVADDLVWIKPTSVSLQEDSQAK